MRTDRGDWSARAVVVATGHCDVPAVPRLAGGLSARIDQMTPSDYRRPDQLREGGVLVVGASASGIQVAEELRTAGRTVIVATGHHLRLPRLYRGKDIMWWLDRSGMLDETADQVYDVEISRNQPSFQLAGRPDRRSLSLVSLQQDGVVIAGRLRAIDGTRVAFEDDLVATTAASDVKLAMLMARLDDFAARCGLDGISDPEPFEPSWQQFTDAPDSLDLNELDIKTVLWATGYRRIYPWLAAPVLDPRGEIRHTRGITPVGGLYVLGLRFLGRRNSNFIDGVGKDALALTASVARHLNVRRKEIA